MRQLGADGLPREVTLTVTNTGKVFGAEIVQHYASKTAGPQADGGVFRPEQELIGFVKVGLEGAGAPNPYEGLALGSYRTGKVAGVGDEEFVALLGRKPPTDSPKIDRNMTVGELGRGRSPLGWVACAVLRRMLRASERRGESELNLLFAYNMPLRGIAKLAGGMVSMGMVDAIVMEVRGFWLVGILRLLVEAVLNAVRNIRLERRLVAAGERDAGVAGAGLRGFVGEEVTDGSN